MTIGSIYGGFFTLIIIATLGIYFFIKFNQIWLGHNDNFKHKIMLNEFENPEFKQIEMKNFNFMPSIAIRLI